jgi:hypothetical protein
MFGPKEEIERGGWRTFSKASEKLHNLYSSPNIIKIMDLKTIRWAEQVAYTRKMRNSYLLIS